MRWKVSNRDYTIGIEREDGSRVTLWQMQLSREAANEIVAAHNRDLEMSEQTAHFVCKDDGDNEMDN